MTPGDDVQGLIVYIAPIPLGSALLCHFAKLYGVDPQQCPMDEPALLLVGDYERAKLAAAAYWYAIPYTTDEQRRH